MSSSRSRSARPKRRPGGPIVLLTDFGTRDGYVGMMKGVIAGLAPGVPVIDLSHDVPPQDLLTAAFLLEESIPFFPDGSVFVCVIDPGVGTARRLVAAATDRHLFLAPDNGLLGFLESAGLLRKRHEISSAAFRLPAISPTFHGRDILAPAAAYLVRGIDVSRLGPPIHRLRAIETVRPRATRTGVAGEVIHIDAFGDAVTNLTSAFMMRAGPNLRVRVGRRTLPLVRTYGEMPRGLPMALFGSGGRLEIAVREGNAARELGLKRGTRVEVVSRRRGRA